jgi:ubiquinone/menaquinone biosynthesis C-methylase UbiE
MRFNQAFQECITMGGFLFKPEGTKVDALYNLFSTHNNLCEDSLYNNLGYWKTANTYDEACEAMVDLVFQHAAFPAGANILDVGCGFCDQDMFWVRKYDLGKITALNIAISQIQVAQERITRAGLQAKIEVQQGTAVNLAFPDESFDGVVSVEAALHFNTRDAFFKEAYRVLKPGGRLVLADSVPFTDLKLWPKLRRWPATLVWRMIQVPMANMYPQDTYLQRLESVGFQNTRITPIGNEVFPGYAKYVSKRVKETEIKERVNPILRAMWGATQGSEVVMNYIIATAEKKRVTAVK